MHILFLMNLIEGGTYVDTLSLHDRNLDSIHIYTIHELNCTGLLGYWGGPCTIQQDNSAEYV